MGSIQAESNCFLSDSVPIGFHSDFVCVCVCVCTCMCLTGGPADGRLLPGDQLLKVNNTTVEDLPPDQVQEMIG